MKYGVVLAWCILALQGMVSAWEQAPRGYQVELPRDHGPHAAQRIEWWYFTGNVLTAEGRRFGYQLTFFRIGVDQKPANPSPWAVRDLHMAHFAISDLQGGKFLHAQRLGRSGPGVAGAAPGTLDVWQENWSAVLQSDGSIRVRAEDTGFSLDLALKSAKPPLLHGANGYSKKGALPGNASIYYSLTDLQSSGSLTTPEGKFTVASGQSWMDHEFGTSFLEPGQQGWDWFSLHLDDGSDLMLFQIRRRDGSIDPSASGTLRMKSGEVVALRQGDFKLIPGLTWESPQTRASYPVVWQIEIPARQLKMKISTPLASQEMAPRDGVGPSYWEGAVDAAGTVGQGVISGRGYLEMTGYNNQGMAQFFNLSPPPAPPETK